MSLLLADVATGAASSGAEAVLFWVFAALALGSALAVVAMRNIVHAALMLVLNLLSIAALYLGLQSSFLSIVQVIVYAGAIVVLFLFVIMLLGVDRDDLLGTRTPVRAVAAVVAGVALAGALLVVVGDGTLTTASACGAQATEATADAVVCAGLDEQSGSSVEFVGERLFTRWTFAFEAASLLLVVATLGALVLGRRRDPAIEDDEDRALVMAAPSPEDHRGATADVRPEHDGTATLEDADDVGPTGADAPPEGSDEPRDDLPDAPRSADPTTDPTDGDA